jgi:hypothetical protein
MFKSSELPKSSELNITALSNLFRDTTNSYKLIFFISLLDILKEQHFTSKPISFKDLIKEMLANAWYPHVYFRLSFGLQDKITEQLDSIGLEISQSMLRFNDSDKKLLRDAIGRSSLNTSLMRYVPYRLLRPFFIEELRGVNDAQINTKIAQLANQLFDERKPLYRVDGQPELIFINKVWIDYLKQNFLIVRAWAAWHWLEYMQKCNPNLPAISLKLFPPQKRDSLKQQMEYWRVVIDHRPIECIYSGIFLGNNRISIDHYLPWSFVTHDQLWNLVPTIPEVNSSKSNHIPASSYFESLTRLQYQGIITTKMHLSERNWEKHLTPFISDLKLENMRELLNYKKLKDAYRRTMFPLITLAENLGFVSNWQYLG